MDPRSPDPQSAAPPPVAKWKVPLIVVGIVAALVVAVALFLRVINGWMKGTGAHKEAVAVALADVRVRDRLGSPIAEDWWVEGSVDFSGDSGNTSVRSTLRGPHGTATLVDSAQEVHGRWHHRALRVVFPGDPTPLDLCDRTVSCDMSPVAPLP